MTPKDLIEQASHDHADIHDVVARLRASLDAGDGEHVRSLLSELLATEVRHYATEDALMRAVAYDRADAHRAEHAAMRETLARIVQAIAVENLSSLSPQVMAHIEASVAHMIDADEQLKRFVTARAGHGIG